MAKLSTAFDSELVDLLVAGGVAVLRTDTIYGIVARADNKAAVERVYHIKGRTPTKSPIVLIAQPESTFDIYTDAELDGVRSLWPGRNSIILPSTQAPDWLTRGNSSVAYRVPHDHNLRQLLERTGPLIAPSANPEGLSPATDVQEAIGYFGDLVDRYIDSGQVIDNTPSRLFKMTSAGLERLR